MLDREERGPAAPIRRPRTTAIGPGTNIVDFRAVRRRGFVPPLASSMFAQVLYLETRADTLSLVTSRQFYCCCTIPHQQQLVDEGVITPFGAQGLIVCEMDQAIGTWHVVGVRQRGRQASQPDTGVWGVKGTLVRGI